MPLNDKSIEWHTKNQYLNVSYHKPGIIVAIKIVFNESDHEVISINGEQVEGDYVSYSHAEDNESSHVIDTQIGLKSARNGFARLEFRNVICAACITSITIYSLADTERCLIKPQDAKDSSRSISENGHIRETLRFSCQFNELMYDMNCINYDAWTSNRFRICKPEATCQIPDQVKNVELTTINGLTYGDNNTVISGGSVTVYCQPGFNVTEIDEVTCISNGTWNTAFPVCSSNQLVTSLEPVISTLLETTITPTTPSPSYSTTNATVINNVTTQTTVIAISTPEPMSAKNQSKYWQSNVCRNWSIGLLVGLVVAIISVYLLKTRKHRKSYFMRHFCCCLRMKRDSRTLVAKYTKELQATLELKRSGDYFSSYATRQEDTYMSSGSVDNELYG